MYFNFVWMSKYVPQRYLVHFTTIQKLINKQYYLLFAREFHKKRILMFIKLFFKIKAVLKLY